MITSQRINIDLLKKDVKNDLIILKDLLEDANTINGSNSEKLDALLKTIITINENAEQKGIDIEDTSEKSFNIFI